MLNSHIDHSEIEDLIPGEIIANEFSKLYKSSEADFEETITQQPIVNQMEDFAKTNNISLADGWKVDLAKQVKKRFEFHTKNFTDDGPQMTKWIQLFRAFTQGTVTETNSNQSARH